MGNQRSSATGLADSTKPFKTGVPSLNVWVIPGGAVCPSRISISSLRWEGDKPLTGPFDAPCFREVLEPMLIRWSSSPKLLS